MSEKEFEREASQLLRGMGLQMDADVLNFFQSDNLTSGNEKWKEGLRKPSSPRRLRRARTTANAIVPKDSIDGQAMRKHSTPATRTQSAAGGDVLDISRRCPPTTNGKHHTTEVENSSEHRHNSQHHHSHHNSADHHHRYHHNHHPQREHKLRPSPVDSQLHHNADATSNAWKSSVPGVHSSTIASCSTSTQAASQTTSDRKQSRPTPNPASLIPRPTSNARTAAHSNGTTSMTNKPPSSATQVLYARKPSLKLLSVTTSSSSIVHSVADRQEQSVSDNQGLLNDANQSAPTTSPTSPPGNTTLRYSSPRPAANDVHSTYDRLELYHKVMSPEPAPPDKPEPSSSLERSASVNSNASQESAASVRSGSSKGRGRGEERDRSSSQPPLSSRQRRWSTPTSVSSSSSMSRSPTPVPWDQPMKKTAPSSSGELYYTTDDSSQSSSLLGRFSPADHTFAASKDTTEKKLALNHRTASASPEPELRTMSALATTTVQALGTLMEVVTPATSMENLEEEDTHGLAAGAASSTMKVPTSNSSERMQSAPPSITPTPTTNLPRTMNHSHYRTSLSAPPSSLPSSLPPSSQPTQPPATITTSSITDTRPSVSVAETVHTRQRSESVKLRRQSLNEEEEEEFFGYCHKCGKTVVGMETGCLALGKVFHTNCFSCSICCKPLSGRTFYTIGSDILCEVDYLNKLNRCYFCNLRIKDRVLTAFGKSYHPSCFKCSVCGLCLDGVPYAGDAQEKIYCVQDYHKLFTPSCSSCGKPIIPMPGKTKNIRVIAQDQYYHVKCYKCEVCGIRLSSNKEKCYPIDGHLFCNQCHLERLQGNVRTTIL